VEEGGIMEKYGGKRQFVYLMGNISPNEQTYLWREIFTDLMKYDPVVILNPCNNEYNQELRHVRAFQRRAEIMKNSQLLLRPKDYQMLKIASVAVWNTNYDDPARPSIASIVEHTWCVDIFNIPVILIACKENPFTFHSWIIGYSAARVKNVEEAVRMVRRYFL